jgi:adenylyltransferase/sulfurtransferase
MSRVTIAAQPVDTNTLRKELQQPGCGGFCVFEGWVRETNEGREVSGLDYEAYNELAIGEGERIIDEAVQRFGIADARCAHRVGSLAVGDTAVWIGVVSPHRDEAFRACRYIIDQVKQRLPIWKKEHYLVGESSWVACAHAPADEHDHAHQG